MATFVQAAPLFQQLGEASSLAAALIWSVSITLYTKFGAGISGIRLNIFKGTVAGTLLLLTVAVLKTPMPSVVGKLPILALSGVVGIAVGDSLFFTSLSRIGAGMTSAVQCLAPLISALIAAAVLGESMNTAETVGMVITVAAVTGVVFFNQRGDTPLALLPRDKLLKGIGYALAAAVCQGVALVLARQAMQEVHVLYGTLARLLPATVVLLLLQWRLSKPGIGGDQKIWTPRKRGSVLTLAAFMGTYLGLMLLSLSTKYTKAGVGAALSSTYPIWVIPVAHVMIGERSNWRSVVFTVFAVLGIVVMVMGGASEV